MEKRAVVEPGQTPDVEDRNVQRPGEKQATAASQTQNLDDDVTHRLADQVAGRVDPSGS